MCIRDSSRGGYEADVTVTRLTPQEFLVVSGAASAVRDVDWIRRNAPDGHRTEVVDITCLLYTSVLESLAR